jgi:hydrogenase expression/formation protein HypE
VVAQGVAISAQNAHTGDAVFVNGTLGDHGTAILIARNQLGIECGIRSDCQPLAGLVAAMIASGAPIHCLRDATRGGLAKVLNEFALSSGVAMRIDEASLPLREEVRGACELLGLDPLYLANEGVLVALVPGAQAARVLAAMRANPAGANAAIIGEVVPGPAGTVVLNTVFGGQRRIDLLVGEQLPRIC